MQKGGETHRRESSDGRLVIRDQSSLWTFPPARAGGLHGRRGTARGGGGGLGTGLLWGWGLWQTGACSVGGRAEGQGRSQGPIAEHGRKPGHRSLSRGGARGHGGGTGAQGVVTGRVPTDAQRGRVVPAPHGPGHAGDVGAALRREAAGHSHRAHGRVPAASGDRAPSVSPA